jgi:hypothetical protein
MTIFTFKSIVAGEVESYTTVDTDGMTITTVNGKETRTENLTKEDKAALLTESILKTDPEKFSEDRTVLTQLRAVRNTSIQALNKLPVVESQTQEQKHFALLLNFNIVLAKATLLSLGVGQAEDRDFD